MSRAYVQFPTGATVDIPKGGLIRSAGNKVFAPALMACTPTGVGFGPLYVGVPDSGNYCSISQLSFLPDEDDGGDGFLFFGIAAGGSKAASNRTKRESRVEAPDDDHQSTRRDVLALAGATLAAAAVGPVKGAAQTDDLAALHIAELKVTALTAPLTIRVLDVVDKVLPATTEILVDAEESRVGEISEPSTGVTLPANTTGKISVYLRDSRGKLSRLLAWASGVVGGDEEITYSRELPKQASEYDEGVFVKLSEHPALVDPVEEAGSGETVLTVGNTTIPHNDQGASEAGSYGIFDGQLIYEVGPNPPASAEWALRTRLGRLAAVSEKHL